jgi:hypothetical protein
VPDLAKEPTGREGVDSRNASGWVELAGLAAVLGLVLLWIPSQQPALLPVRVWMALCAALLAIGAWRRRRVLLEPRTLVLAGALFAATLAIALAPALLAGERSAYVLGQRLVPALLGWAFFLFLPLRGAADSVVAADVTRPWRWALAIVVFAFAAVTLAHGTLQGSYAPVVDEVLYLLQARMLAEPGYGRAMDPALVPFFLLKQSAIIDGRLITQYPPGWPAILALFDAIGLRWWTTIAFSVLAVWLTYRLGVKLHSQRAGLIAAALMASNQYVVLIGGSYFPHLPTAALVTATALALLGAEDRHGRAAALRWAAAGLLLGVAVAVRPLSGVAIGVSLVAWTLFRTRPRARRVALMAVMLCLGALLPAAAVLHYNQATTGDPLRFGYSAVNGEYHDIGFGQRGWIAVDSTGQRVPDLIDFTPARAVQHLFDRLYEFGLRVPPFFALAPLLLVAALFRCPFRWRVVVAFLVLPFVHFFYYYTSSRFYIELFPFLFAALAIACAHIRSRSPALGRVIVAAIVGAQLLLTAQNVHRVREDRSETFFPHFRAVLDAHQREGPVLIFVHETTREPQLLQALAWFSITGHTGDIVVARDLGDRNTLLMDRLPGHTPFRLTPGPRSQPTPLVPIR